MSDLLQNCKALSAVGLLAASIVVAPPVQAASWTGGNGNWSSNGNPGWNGTGVPDAVGAVADHPNAASATTTQDVVAGVTVGTISLTNNSNHSWTFTLTNGITLNQDGAGSGSATISNTNSTANTSNFIQFNSGTLTLADNLLISNTGASTRTGTGAGSGGSIGFANTSVIAGSGNITIDNVLNDLAGVGSIRLSGGTNTFTGAVNVRSGGTTFTGNSTFGASGNVITLGASGAGSASLLATAGVTLANDWVVAAGSGGTLTLGSTGTAGQTWSGTGTLNGDLTLFTGSSSSTKFKFDGVIGGTGSFTMTSAGAGYTEMSRANTYSGSTTVSSGILSLTNALALQNSALDTTASVSGTATAGLRTGVTTLTLGGLTGNKNLADVFSTGTGASAGAYGTVTALTLNPGTGVTRTYSAAIANGAANMTLTKTGNGTQILGGANTYTGATSVQQGVLLVDGSTAADSAVSVSLGAVIGGNGTVNGSLTLANGALFAFDTGDTLDLIGNLSLDSSFGVDSLRNTSGTSVDWANIAQGTYTLIDTSFTFNSGNISNFGQANQKTGLAGGKSAYFQQGTSPTSSLQLVVVPEPASVLLTAAGAALCGAALWRRRRS